ncbi:PREDICTED: uncharacterized protein LOC109181374 [Ipomoea nil]|uniref:uncharacterized protein LOC109181374 n=1 Tax=Ipomoea nil TaxID=35883 RepID=UPI00090150D3|nr:PREDICTED: uncharacterized protein LOC109181374 [Ipomoea nil]
MTIVLDKVIEELITQKVIALVQTVEDNVKLVRGIDSEIKDLSSDIETFNARLVEASKNPRANDHQVLRVVVKKFTTLVNEAQDTIANYFALKKKHGDDVLSKSFDKIPFCGKINVYANEIQSIRANLDKINKVHENELLYLMKYKMKDRNKAETTLQVRPPIEKNKVLGFEEDFQIIKKHFLEASKNFIVIPIVGMAGTGKTTFASMIFEDPEIHRNSLRIWVHVTKLYDRKQKFISIIYRITKDTWDFSTMTEEMLEGKIKILLKDQTYFIVLDDVWEKKDWQYLKDAFPENLNGSKVLVTSRYGNVVDSKWNSHHLGKLTNEDGWSVIKNNVFSAEECSDKLLEKLGKKIARKCNGLPLALVVVAGILRRCVTSDDWRRVAENPLLEINRDDQNYHELVKLSYDDLPHEKLKNCFLYFAYFPMGHEIATWKLIRLWIAEEFIPTIDEWGYSIEAEIEAKKYLNDLIDANLVMVIKRRADGQTKTCRIHDTLYEFCKSEAARKNLFLLMEEGQRLDENTSSTRRLCFHSFTTHIFDAENKSSRLFLNCYNKRSLSPFGKHIHSLLLSSPQKSETPFKQDQLAAIPNMFPLLRVLNIENIKFNDLLDKDLANELYSLYLLKYLAISGNLNVLPKSFRSLRELETLVIKTTARTLQIEGGIWNMEKLRHVRTNTSAQLPFPPQTNCKTYSGGKDIHTLSTISPASCREEIFNKTPNLRKLGVRGNLIELFEEKENICLFNNLQKLKCLVNLKLYGQYDKVLTVPMLDKFASRLKKLSFSGTLFEWKDMAVLGSLEELEVLKLGDYAFKGETWELSNDVVFIRLQYLRIGRTNLVTWKATEDSFPALQNLILRNCNVIKRIPEVFAKVHTLKVMELFHVSESATRSIKEVQENVKNGGFKLIIITSQKREGAMTAARDTLIEQAVSEAVNHLVKYVEQRLRFENGGLDWEIKNLISDIETFNARLEEAYKNPNESVNVLIVKNFQTIVNEACDAVDNQRTMYFDHKDKTFIRKFLVPHYRREVKSCETEIQSVRTKVNTIDNEHKEELETLTNYDKPPLIFQIEKSTVYDGVIEAIEKVVNMLHQKIEGNVNIVSEIKDMTSQIKTFTDNLVKACKNPKANEHRVLKVIVKKFQILVNETMNTVTKYFAQEKKNGKNALAKSLDKIAHCGKPNAYASEIQSIKKKVNKISEDHTKDLLHILEEYNKREGPITAARDTLIEQAVSEAVNNLVGTTEFCGFLENSSLEWLIKKMTFDIKTFNARLEEAYKNPTESVNILIVKNFQTIVNEAQDAVENCWRKNLDHEDKTFIKNFLVPRYRREVKSCESEIQSVRTKVNMIDREHKKELETLCNYENNAPLIFQKSTVYDRAIEGIEQKVNMLHQKVEENVNGVCDIVSEIKDMTSLIKMFTEDLVKACKNPKANEHRVLKVIVNKFGILVIETLNAVTNYFAQEKKYRNNVLAKSLDKIAHCGKPNAYASEIQSIKEKVKRISKDHTIDLLHLSEDYNKLRDMPVPKVRAELRENKMVGFDNDDLKTIKTRLMEASEDFFVIPIVGNAGTGKTTFALKVFEDLEIREYFTHCVWLPVSRGFQRKQKFIDILHQISNQTEDFSTVLEDVLEAKIKEILEDKRYLIVLDDVWEKEAWDSLKVAFPTNMKGSRVLVTTLSGNAVDSTWKSHSLVKLSNDDGWLLIKNIVFGTKGWCDTKIEELGIKIAEKCNGLPHALVLVAGILRHRITSAGWQRVADNPLLEIKGEDQRYHELIKLSYYDLPDERLKRCFLYFACFPMGHEIVAWKLICLWIAEYFIPTKDDWGPLDKEVEASNYLNVLINRNLVIVKKRSADGQIKTCCIHDTLHEFCRREAERINLFHVMDEGQRLNARIRLERLCSYYTMNIVDEENNNPSDSFSNLFNKRMGPHQDGEFLHSLLLSSSQKTEIHSTPEQLETILKTFKYLKVLSIESLKFSSLPNYFPLYFMRYLAIIGDISSLPMSLEHLSRLETLVIKTTERALQINGGIWNMEELRHVHTNTSTQLPYPPKTGKHGCKQIDIRTLSTISPGSCTNEIFNMTPKLQKLSVRGDLSELLEEKQNVCLFNNLQMLECLENLKLHGNSEKVKLKVPMSDKFPRRLRKLTLSATLFQWNDMSVLGLLDRLKVLKLDDNAFSGEDWDLSSDVIFKGLQYLRIGKTNLKTWTVVEPEKSFPVLETLVLKNCISLQNIPQGFANVDSLELIELFDVSKKVADFAREICEKRHGKTNVKINGFITPLPSQATVHNLAYEYEYVNTSGFDYPNTSISSQEIVHNLAYDGNENVNNTSRFDQSSTSTSSQEMQSNGEKNVNISGFDHPSTSTSSQGIVHKQSIGEENVNTSGFNHPSTSTLSPEIVNNQATQAYGDEHVNTRGFNQPSTSTSSQEIVHKQSNGEKNINISGFDHPSTSTSSQRIVNNQVDDNVASYEDENVNTSGFDQPSTSTSSQEIVHNQAYESSNENVNTNGFDHPGTSIPSQEIAHKQSHGVENVSTSEFDNPSTSTLSQEIVSDD